MNPPRRPRPATHSTALPTLSAAIAASTLHGCAEPQCGATPLDEVRAHGPVAVDRVRDAHGEGALREIAVAVGLRGHQSTRPEGPEVQAAGAVPVHQPEPRVTAGEAAPVTTTPPSDPSVGVDGAMRIVRPSVPEPPPRRPHPRVRPSGGASVAHPVPARREEF